MVETMNKYNIHIEEIVDVNKWRDVLIQWSQTKCGDLQSATNFKLFVQSLTSFFNFFTLWQENDQGCKQIGGVDIKWEIISQLSPKMVSAFENYRSV